MKIQTNQKRMVEEAVRRFNFMVNYDPAKGGQYLTEELHIADEVKELTAYIEFRLSKYNNRYKDSFNFIITKEDYLSYLSKIGFSKEESNPIVFFEKITIQGYIKNYTSVESMGRGIGTGELIKNPKIDYTTQDNKNTRADIKIDNPIITLQLCKLNGEPYPPKYHEVIQHEVSHLYETIKKLHNKNYGYTKNNIRLLDKYNIAKEHFNSNNEIIKTFSEIYYYLDRGEQSAFSNGLYRCLVADKPPLENIEENYLINTIQYKQLGIFNDVLKDIDNFVEDDEWNEAKILFFGQSPSNEQVKSSIKIFLYREIPNFQRKLFGVVMKYKKDCKITEESRKKFEELMSMSIN